MGYNVSAYAVPLSHVRAAIGSGDADLLAAITAAAARYGRIDAQDEDLYDADGGEPPVATMAEVVRHLVAGEAYERVGFKYGYALELICRHVGQLLSNAQWSALRWEWLEEVDAALTAANVPAGEFRVTRHLVCRGSPVPLPRIEDFPSIGYLTAGEIPGVAAALDGPGRAAAGDEVGASLDELRGWLRTCCDTGRDLVCFYG